MHDFVQFLFQYGQFVHWKFASYIKTIVPAVVALVQSGDLILENAGSIAQLSDLRFIVLASLSQLTAFLFIPFVLGARHRRHLLIQSLYLIAKTDFLHLKLRPADFQVTLLFCKLLDGLVHVGKLQFKFLDPFFVMLFNSWLLFRHAFADASVLFSQGFNFLLKVTNLEFVFGNLFFVILNFFRFWVALDQGLDFLFKFLVAFQMLFNSFLQFFVLLLVEIDVFKVVFNQKVGLNVSQFGWESGVLKEIFGSLEVFLFDLIEEFSVVLDAFSVKFLS